MCLAFAHLRSDHNDPLLRRAGQIGCDSLTKAKWYPDDDMKQPGIQCLLVAAAICLCASAPSQTVTEDSHPGSVQGKAVHPTDHPTVFSLNTTNSPGGANSEAAQAIEFRTLDQMTPKDRELAANAESSIAERATYTDLEFNQGTWSYEQVACPALPNHLFLRFMRNNGTGDVSLFTASIPRGDEGRVRIIPIQLRGYSLFSPAPINALTISAFNHIRAEENPDKAPAPNWLGTGLCYGALAGGHPQAPDSVASPEMQKPPVAMKASLEVPGNGGAIISFSDVAAAPRPMLWTMTFDGKGRLLKATHSPAPLLAVVKRDHSASVEPARPASNSAPAPVARPIPGAPTALTDHPVVPTPNVETPGPTPVTNTPPN